MATPLRRALVDADERVRVYTPYGELIPGMAYLVRRLLENTSQTSFLRQGFAEGESPEQLLRNPVDVGAEDDSVDAVGSPVLIKAADAEGGNAEFHGGTATGSRTAMGSGVETESGAGEGNGDVLDTSPERIARISPMPPHAAEALVKDPM